MRTAGTTQFAYTVEEAAELLSISRAQFYRLIDLGEIESVNIGRSRRVTQGQLTQIISNLEFQNTIQALPPRIRN